MKWRAAFLALCFAACVGTAWGHHILGIPHYAYDKDYPQTPVLTYRVDMGPHEIKMTSYPGRPEPGGSCSLHVYIRRLDTGESFDDTVTMTVLKDPMIGRDTVVYGPMKAQLEESIYKFYPQFKEEANYLVRIAFEAEDAPWIIDLPMVVGHPGSPWTVLGSVAAATVVFLIVVRAIRIKKRRRMAKTPGAGQEARS